MMKTTNYDEYVDDGDDDDYAGGLKHKNNGDNKIVRN